MSNSSKPITIKKRKFVMPDTLILVSALTLLMCILSFILPSGSYDFAEDGKTVIAGSYHAVEPNPQGLFAFLNSYHDGLMKGAKTIFVTFLIGGAFQVLTDTGAIEAVLVWIIRKTKGNYKPVIISVMVVMGILGALGVGNNIALAFAPIMLILASKMKLDPIVAAACMHFASNTGFLSSPINPFTALLAQNIAGVPQMSGAIIRLVLGAVFVCAGIWYTLRYCKRVLADSSYSFTGLQGTEENEEEALSAISSKFTKRHILCLVYLFALFAVYTYGSIEWSWDISALGAVMMALAMGCATFGGMTPNQAAKSFANGAKTMIYAALLLGFASGINVVMTNGNIIHTIIYGLSIPLQYLPKALAAVGMFIVNFFFNFFVNSGSGQCYVVMPLMAPMADILGISRQVAISCFQLGDGISNAIFPTSGLLMACLGICHVPLNKWLKFAVPVTLINVAIASVFLVAATVFGWA